MLWDPPTPPLVAQEADEECPGGGDKSVHALLGPTGHFHFLGSLEERAMG